MASVSTDEVGLRFGGLSRVHVQVGFREVPDGPAELTYLLDLPLREPDPGPDRFDEQPFLDALRPVLLAGADGPRHYSVHSHRWHTSWGPSAGALDLGVTVTLGPHRPKPGAVDDGVLAAFRALLALGEAPESAPVARDDAVRRARRGVATAYDVDPDRLSLVAETHDRERAAWSLGLRGAGGWWDVVVGLVDGHAGSVRMQHRPAPEVDDSVGTE